MINDEFDDEESGEASLAGPEWTVDEVTRLKDPEVAYMELADAAGAFSCGNCVWAGEGIDDLPDAAECMNDVVMAPVSAKNGCCNFFEPADKDKLAFPSAEELEAGYDIEADELGEHADELE